MARLTGLFLRGGSYYLRIVLPEKHPLRSQYPNGRWVQSLGSCSYLEALKRGMARRAEILCGYNTPTQPVQTPLTPIEVAASPIQYLRDVYEEWCDAIPRTADTIATCGRALALFEKLLDNPPIQSLNRAQGLQFRTKLQSLPGASKTARDRLLWVRSLLKFAAEDMECLPKNPWAGLDLPFKTANKRRPWSQAELKTFYGQPLFTEYALPTEPKAGLDAAYWIPVLGLYTGARLGELAQLNVEDVKCVQGTHILSISDEGEWQTVKTTAAIRLVPIHSELIRLGFLKYVDIQKNESMTKLWPSLPFRKSKPGGYFSQWFGQYRKALGFGLYPDFHCLRHTVRSQLADAEVQEQIIDMLLGHEVKGSTGATVYTHRSLSALKKAIEVIAYPKIELPPILT